MTVDLVRETESLFSKSESLVGDLQDVTAKISLRELGNSNQNHQKLRSPGTPGPCDLRSPASQLSTVTYTLLKISQLRS